MSLQTCIICEQRPARELPTPIPEDTEVMFTEMVADKALYCQECFDDAGPVLRGEDQ